MILGGSLMPVPYVIEQPGPAIDVLGTYDDEQILVIDGAETHPTEGSLMMTTVSVDGGPGYQVTPVEVAVSWFDRTRAVDRKSTRLNSSHVANSYAVFCLYKKTAII